LYGVTDLSCVYRGCETATLSVDRLLGHSFKAPKVPCTLGVLSEWPTSRSTDNVGLAASTNKLEFTYAIQCIRRRVLTYTWLHPRCVGVYNRVIDSWQNAAIRQRCNVDNLSRRRHVVTMTTSQRRTRPSAAATAAAKTRYSTVLEIVITFRMRHSRGEMYIDHGRLCACVFVCVSVCLSVCPSPHSHTTARSRM